MGARRAARIWSRVQRGAGVGDGVVIRLTITDLKKACAKCHPQEQDAASMPGADPQDDRKPHQGAKPLASPQL